MNKILEALHHPNKLGSGAKKRNALHLNEQQEFEVITKEFKRGTLYSGSGHKVTNINQAKAIAISELKKRGGKK